MSYNLLSIIIIAISIIINGVANAHNKDCINVMDYISDTSKDVAAYIQTCIDENPNRVIYFPDGIYLISTPLKTPANPDRSVSLELSNYAIIKPITGWNHDEAMICLGGKNPYNTIIKPGSNYYLSGGIIDCMGIAKGISIDSGRESMIRYTSIKNSIIGIHIKKGANNNSSDADIMDVNITCNEGENSIGILLEGYDNTLTNLRIYKAQVGVKIFSQANILRNVHVLYGTSNDELYNDGCGFIDNIGNNWYDFCYSDQFSTGFFIKSGSSIYHNCFAFWYSNKGEKHIAFKSFGPFNSVVTNFTMGINKNNAVSCNEILEELNASVKGKGCFQNLQINDSKYITSKMHEQYIK